jgi:hypothetical protein
MLSFEYRKLLLDVRYGGPAISSVISYQYINIFSCIFSVFGHHKPGSGLFEILDPDPYPDSVNPDPQLRCRQCIDPRLYLDLDPHMES